MHKPLHTLLLLLSILLLCIGLSACGNGQNQTVATVGQSKISRATLNHWMSTVAGGDYHQILGKRAPAGLASEPADYPRCVKAAERIVAQAEASHRPHFSHAQLQTKCRQLYTALKEQALGYLIAVLWRAEEGRELGANVSDREIDQRVNEIRRTEYANPAQFDRYLAERNWTIGDERYLLKRNMLDDKFLARLKAQVARQGGGQQTLIKLIRQAFAKLSAKTSCSPGYRAWGCKQYGLAEAVKPSPAQLIEYLAGTNAEPAQG